jgi:hypothetical protein
MTRTRHLPKPRFLAYVSSAESRSFFIVYPLKCSHIDADHNRLMRQDWCGRATRGSIEYARAQSLCLQRLMVSCRMFATATSQHAKSEHTLLMNLSIKGNDQAEMKQLQMVSIVRGPRRMPVIQLISVDEFMSRYLCGFRHRY